jgi:hypothetical protein
MALSEAVTMAAELVKGLAGGLLVAAGEIGGDGEPELLETSCSFWTFAGDFELRRGRRGASETLGDGGGSLFWLLLLPRRNEPSRFTSSAKREHIEI